MKNSQITEKVLAIIIIMMEVKIILILLKIKVNIQLMKLMMEVVKILKFIKVRRKIIIISF